MAKQSSAKMDPFRTVEEVLSLFRRLGREKGLDAMKKRIDQAKDHRERTQLRFIVAWLAGERGDYLEVESQLHEIDGTSPTERTWADLCRGFVAVRRRHLNEAEAFFNQAAAEIDLVTGSRRDPIPEGVLEHGRGTLAHHRGNVPLALNHLFKALESFGNKHFGTGRVLDTIGMCYATMHSYGLARQFYEQAILHKREFNDILGLAVSHGQLGRLALEWGELDLAEKHFREDLRLAEQGHDLKGAAKMYNALGAVKIGREHFRDAISYLDESIRRQEAVPGWERDLAYSLKDRALANAYHPEKRTEAALADANRALKIFSESGFSEGICHANLSLGIAHRHHVATMHESEPLLREAANQFHAAREPAMEARALLELARTLAECARRALVFEDRAAFVKDMLEAALRAAESARLDPLVSEIEKELRKVDEATYWRLVYQRARGLGIRENILDESGFGEEASILFLDLKDFSLFVGSEDAHIVLKTLNQIFWDFANVLEVHNIAVNQYLGDGFMALVRGEDHEFRAVAGGLDLLKIAATFNRPRAVLELHTLQPRIGIATGMVTFGNVGTSHKKDFTAVGSATNLAARLQSECKMGTVCVAQRTYERIARRVAVLKAKGRPVDPKNFERQTVWDVTAVLAQKPQDKHESKKTATAKRKQRK